MILKCICHRQDTAAASLNTKKNEEKGEFEDQHLHPKDLDKGWDKWLGNGRRKGTLLINLRGWTKRRAAISSGVHTALPGEERRVAGAPSVSNYL